MILLEMPKVGSYIDTPGISLSRLSPREQHTTTDSAKECQESGPVLGLLGQCLEHRGDEHPLKDLPVTIGKHTKSY